MGKYLPIIIPVALALIVLVAGYFYLQSGKIGQNGPVEVPKTLPEETRVANLESSVSSLVAQLDSLKGSLASASPQTQSSTLTDLRLKALEAATTELKARVSAVEKASPSPSAAPKYPLYIPLGSGGSSGDQNWVALSNYQISLNPTDYPGYSSVQLEVNLKLDQQVGTARARLYNSTDNSATSSEVSSTSDKYVWLTSSGFSLASGSKTYQLQLKSDSGFNIQIQSARLKVNF